MTTSTPAVAGWFTTGDEPRLVASRCTSCGTLVFPPPPPEAASFCRNPVCDGETHEPAELSRRGRVWSYTDAQYQPPRAVHPDHRPVRAVRAGGGRAAGGPGRARPGGRRLRRRPTSRSVPRWSWSWRRSTRTRPASARSGAGSPWSSSARRPNSEHASSGRGCRHAPVGQVGPPVRGVRRARRPCRSRRLRHRVERRRLRGRWRDGAQRLRRLRRGLDVRVGTGLERRADRDVVRRLRDGCPGARHRAGPDPGRPLRGRPGRRRGHHAEGLPGAERRRAVDRPRLAAVQAARHDEPGVLRALRAPPDGPLRRDQRGLRAGEGQERPARVGEPERALPQGGRGRRRARLGDRVRPAPPARHLRDVRRRGGSGARPSSTTRSSGIGVRRPGAGRGGLDGDADLPQRGHRHAAAGDRPRRRWRARADVQGVDRARRRTRRPASVPTTSTSPRSTTSPPPSSSTGSRTSGSASAARPRCCSAPATRPSVAGSRSTRPAGWPASARRCRPRRWPRSASSPGSCAARPPAARSRARGSGSPPTRDCSGTGLRCCSALRSR